MAVSNPVTHSCWLYARRAKCRSIERRAVERFFQDRRREAQVAQRWLSERDSCNQKEHQYGLQQVRTQGV